MKLKEYEVLYVEHGKNTAYICRKPPESKTYRVIEASDKTRIAGYIKYFVDCKPKEFYEDFCLNEKYYAVFAAPDGIPLKVSGEHLTARRVVRALAMQNPPPGIAVNILTAEHIFLCGEELEFAYDLPETSPGISREYFFGKLADFVEPLWETDGDRRFEKWLDDLRGGKFEDLLSAYRHMPESAEEKASPNKERLKKIIAAAMKIAVAIAAVSAIAAAVLALGKGDEEDADYSRMEALGTIDLTEE